MADDKKNAGKMISGNGYTNWVEDLKKRYISARLKAVRAVNASLIEFYWNLGKDIEDRSYANTYGTGFFRRLSIDLQHSLPDAKGFSVINLRYMHRFYCLYAPVIENVQHPVEQLDSLFSIPWFHHQRIIDKCKGDVSMALFYVRKTVENNWSRTMLANFMDTDLYHREGKAITNFVGTLPRAEGDLAQQLTKDPYCFDFLTLREEFDEKELEDALVSNVTRFLLELGTGFSYMGRQFRLEVGAKEFFPDLLFYNTRLHAYCVVELKTSSFKPEYLGQLSFYVSAINHQFRSEADNPTIGLLICRDKDSVVAKYALEPYSQPLGISEYQLSELYPADFKSSMPTIKEIEGFLDRDMSKTR